MHNTIDISILPAIKERTVLSQVVSRYLDLKRAGKDMRACCPFHNERTPSFFVTDRTGLYHCFGCGASGDVITFLQQMEHMPFVEAVAKLADELGIAINEQLREQLRQQAVILHENTDRQIVYRSAIQFHGIASRLYLARRNIGDVIIESYGIGYDIPSKRITLPITDKAGRILAFTKRSIFEDVHPKYLHDRNNSLYKTSETLFGIQQASLPSNKYFVIVEGPFDVLRVASIARCVAINGSSMSKTQAEMIARTVDGPVVLMFDGDEAGTKSILSATKQLTKKSVCCMVAEVPPNKDPGTMSEKEIQTTIDKSLNFFGWAGRKYKQTGDLSFIAKALEILTEEKSSVARDRNLLELAAESGIGKDTLKQDAYKRFKRKGRK